jgi:hypothetical protein
MAESRDRRSFFRALKAHQTAPTDGTDDRIARAEIILERAEVYLDGNLWLGPKTPLKEEDIAAEATLIVEYLSSFGEFFGNAEGAIRGYWMFLCWLYAAPVAPCLRQTAIINSGDPLAYPVFGILYGRPNGGKSWFCETVANSMFRRRVETASRRIIHRESRTRATRAIGSCPARHR